MHYSIADFAVVRGAIGLRDSPSGDVCGVESAMWRVPTKAANSTASFSGRYSCDTAPAALETRFVEVNSDSLGQFGRANVAVLFFRGQGDE